MRKYILAWRNQNDLPHSAFIHVCLDSFQLHQTDLWFNLNGNRWEKSIKRRHYLDRTVGACVFIYMYNNNDYYLSNAISIISRQLFIYNMLVIHLFHH